MVGGTGVPPQDSRGEPWSGQAQRILLGTKLRSTNSASSSSHDGRAGKSLDNADAVIDAATTYRKAGSEPTYSAKASCQGRGGEKPACLRASMAMTAYLRRAARRPICSDGLPTILPGSRPASSAARLASSKRVHPPKFER